MDNWLRTWTPDAPIERGATVYADPPYRNTRPGAYAEFDYRKFDEWLASVDFPVYVSEYTCPDGCVEIARREKNQTCAANCTKRVQEDEERNQSLDDLHDYASGNDLKRALGHPELQKERELPKAPADTQQAER